MARHQVALLSLLSTSIFACASLLGDFTTGESQDGGGDDSGSDGNVGDHAAGGDSPGGDAKADGALGDSTPDDSGEGGIPLIPLKCVTWKLAQPALVQSLDAFAGSSAGDFGSITPFPDGPTKTRVVAPRFGGITLFSVYEIDSSQSPAVVTSVDAPYVGMPNSAGVAAVKRLADGYGVVVSYIDAQGFVDVDLYPFRDATPISPLPTPVRLAQTQEINSSVQASLLEVAPSKYFVALTTFGTVNNTYALQVGLSAGTPANMLTIDSGAQNNFGGIVLAHVASNVFIYVIGSGGPALYQVPDTGSSGGTRQAIQRASSNLLITGLFTDAVTSAAPNTTNLGYMELDANDAGTGFGSFALQAAAVSNFTLPNLKISDISFGKTYTDLASVPGPLNPGQFFGDDFVAISPGLDPQSDPTSWVNFLWLDMHGVVRGDQSGINGLLPGIGSNLSQNGQAIAATPGPRSAQQAAWNVVWNQQVRDDAGLFSDSLYYNELDCMP